MQIDFSESFDRVNYQGILYRLYSAGIGGSVLSILTQFLSNRSQHVMVDAEHIEYRKVDSVLRSVEEEELG